MSGYFVPPKHLNIISALWQGAPSYWKRHSSSPACSWMIGRCCSLRMFWYGSLFLSVLWASGEWAHRPDAWVASGCSGVDWHMTDGGAQLFHMPQTIREGIHQRKCQRLQSWAGCSLDPLQNRIVCPSYWSWGEVDSLCVQMDSARLLLFLSQPCTSSTSHAPPWRLLHNNYTSLLQVVDGECRWSLTCSNMM